MKAFTVTFNSAQDLTKINYANEFKNANKITKLDILKDAISDLQTEYDDILEFESYAN